MSNLFILSIIDCGEANFQGAGRVVHGVRATTHKYPWMAAMFIESSYHCQGSIVTMRNILTAGE